MKAKKIYAVFIMLLFVAVIACSVSFVMLCIGGADPHLYIKRDSGKIDSPASLEESFDFGDGYIKRIVFVADRSMSSLTEHCPAVEASQVWSGADGNLSLDYNLPTTSVIHSADGSSASIPDAAALYKPHYILITIGLDNGVGHCTEEKFKEYYLALINAVKEASPDTRLILQSILPVGKQAEKDSSTISNERINEANRWIAELCEEHSLRYLDTASALKDSKGRLDAKYDSGDGITLNAEGYAAVLEYIRTHGYVRLKEPQL